MTFASLEAANGHAKWLYGSFHHRPLQRNCMQKSLDARLQMGFNSRQIIDYYDNNNPRDWHQLLSELLFRCSGDWQLPLNTRSRATTIFSAMIIYLGLHHGATLIWRFNDKIFTCSLNVWFSTADKNCIAWNGRPHAHLSFMCVSIVVWLLTKTMCRKRSSAMAMAIPNTGNMCFQDKSVSIRKHGGSVVANERKKKKEEHWDSDMIAWQCVSAAAVCYVDVDIFSSK